MYLLLATVTPTQCRGDAKVQLGRGGAHQETATERRIHAAAAV